MGKRIEKLKSLYQKVDAWTGGRLDILARSYLRFLDLGGPEAAAGMAYYALFAMFPLTLLMVSVLGFVLESTQAYNQALTFVVALFPFARELITQNLTEVLEKRTAIGSLGLLGLIWSASGFFTLMARNVNRAWPSVKLRNFVQSRLVALAMVGALFLLLLLSLISSALLNLLPGIVRTFGLSEAILQLSLWRGFLRLVPPVFTFLLFLGLYRWVPNKTVRWRPALIGSAIITLVWELAKSAFTVYLASGIARYEIIYGSLATLIVLMVWTYVGNAIALFGAHLVATMDVRADQVAPQKRPANVTLSVENVVVNRLPKPVKSYALQNKAAKPELKVHGHELEKDVPKGVRG